MKKKANYIPLDPLIANHIDAGLFCYDTARSTFTFINTSLPAILKYPSKAALIKCKLEDIFETKGAARSFMKKLQKETALKAHSVVLRRKDKKLLRTRLTAKLKRTKGAKHGLIEGLIEAQSFLEEVSLQNHLFENLLDNIPDAIYFKDKNNKLIKVNKFYASGLKIKKEDIVGKTDYDFFPPEQAQRMFEDDNYVLKTGKPIVGKIEKTLLPNGTWNQVVTTKVPIYGDKKTIVGTMGITRDITAFSNLENEKLQMSIDAIRALSKIHELKDPYTSGHSNRVSVMAECITKEMGWSEKDILGMKIVGQLHDIGKIIVPAEILSKPGKLSDVEYMIIQQHVQNCYSIVKDISLPFPLAEAIYQHHERLNGKGYPKGIKNRKIIPAARILAVCDVLEAMTCHRPYREALGLKEALKELKSGMGKRYDAQVVKIVLKLIRRNKGKPFWQS